MRNEVSFAPLERLWSTIWSDVQYRHIYRCILHCCGWDIILLVKMLMEWRRIDEHSNFYILLIIHLTLMTGKITEFIRPTCKYLKCVSPLSKINSNLFLIIVVTWTVVIIIMSLLTFPKTPAKPLHVNGCDHDTLSKLTQHSSENSIQTEKTNCQICKHKVFGRWAILAAPKRHCE